MQVIETCIVGGYEGSIAWYLPGLGVSLLHESIGEIARALVSIFLSGAAGLGIFCKNFPAPFHV